MLLFEGIFASFLKIKSRVSDPYSFFTDPDPEPEDPDGGQYGSGSGSRALMTKNGKKITAEKKIKFFFDQKLQFTYPEASIKYVQVTERLRNQRIRMEANTDPDPDPGL